MNDALDLRLWSVPDLGLFLFTNPILEGKPIDVFNHGKMRRDFTYIVEGVIRVLDRTAASNPDWNGKNPDPASSKALSYTRPDMAYHSPLS